MLWWSITAILAVAFAVLALSNALYDLTSPPLLSFHVWLRKLYSLAAFASVGYSYSRARLGGGAQQPLWESGAAVGAYSACIELLQFAPDVPGTTGPAHILPIDQAKLCVLAALHEQQRGLAPCDSREEGRRGAAEVSIGFVQLLVRFRCIGVEQLRAIRAELEEAVSVVVPPLSA